MCPAAVENVRITNSSDPGENVVLIKNSTNSAAMRESAVRDGDKNGRRQRRESASALPADFRGIGSNRHDHIAKDRKRL